MSRRGRARTVRVAADGWAGVAAWRASGSLRGREAGHGVPTTATAIATVAASGSRARSPWASYDAGLPYSTTDSTGGKLRVETAGDAREGGGPRSRA